MTIFFHVTKGSVVKSIEERGVLSEFSSGARDVSWWVKEARIEWAILHVCARYRARVDEIWVVAADINDSDMRRTSLNDVYYTPLEAVKIRAATQAETIIENRLALREWVDLMEIPF